MFNCQKIIGAVVGAGFVGLVVGCAAGPDSATTANAAKAQSTTKKADEQTITGSRLPSKQTEKLVHGADGQEIERYRPPNPGKAGGQ